MTQLGRQPVASPEMQLLLLEEIGYAAICQPKVGGFEVSPSYNADCRRHAGNGSSIDRCS